MSEVHFRTKKKYVEQAERKGIATSDYKKVVHDSPFTAQKKMMKPIFSKVPGAYQIDLLAQSKGASPPFWFIFINVNSRRAYAYPCGGKNIDTIKNVLNKFLQQVGEVTQFTSDREPAFLSDKIIDWLVARNIDLHVTEENDHNKLGIINRFMRTLRDMNEEHRDIEEGHMKELLDEYNNSTHTSTKTTPVKFNDEEKYIDTMQRYTDDIEAMYPLHKDDDVRIIIPKSKFAKRRRNLSKTHLKVVDRDKNQFIVQAKDHSIETYPRYMLKPSNDNSKLATSLNDDKKGLVTKITGQVKVHGKTMYRVGYEGGSTDLISAKELNRNNPTKNSPLIAEFLDHR
jgi:hypothetical protein